MCAGHWTKSAEALPKQAIIVKNFAVQPTYRRVALTSFASFASAEKISIAVGHQSMCTDTYTAGIIVKELGLLEKYLPTDGKYADADYDVSWADYSSGGPITNQMLANKLNFGVMGDYPLIVNGIDQLKGMEVSTPVGSAAWGMLLKAMQDNNIPTGEYVLKNQSPAVGAANIAVRNRCSLPPRCGRSRRFRS